MVLDWIISHVMVGLIKYTWVVVNRVLALDERLKLRGLCGELDLLWIYVVFGFDKIEVMQLRCLLHVVPGLIVHAGV